MLIFLQQFNSPQKNVSHNLNGIQINRSIESQAASTGTESFSLTDEIAFYELSCYNGLNQLISTRVNGSVVSYSYAPSGLRLSKTVDDTETSFLLDGDNVVAEQHDGVLTAYYARGLNLFASFIGEDQNYYLYNGHGDVVQLTDTSGAVSKTYEYDAFGNEKDPASNDLNPFRYCAEYFDTETRRYYLRARYYDSALGRFTQVDSAYDGINWYVYCLNNPIHFIDPSGHITQEEVDMFESGNMAPMAYTYLMRLTYSWWLADTTEQRAYWHQKANDFRATGYTNSGLWYIDDAIKQMPTKPSGFYLSQEDHYFRNILNIEYTWTTFKKLQSRLPDNLKWEIEERDTFHQNNRDGGDNIKYVSADGHFEIIYSAKYVLQNERNNPEDMGTYNYFGPKINAFMHTVLDVLPYSSYKNTEAQWRESVRLQGLHI